MFARPLPFRRAFRLALLLPVALPAALLPVALGLRDTPVGEAAGVVVILSMYGAVPYAAVALVLALLSREYGEAYLLRAAWASPIAVGLVAALPVAAVSGEFRSSLMFGGIGLGIGYVYVVSARLLLGAARHRGLVEWPEAPPCDRLTFPACESSSSG